MYKYIVSGIEGAQNYGLISLVIFATFFTLLIIWAIKRDGSYVKYMSDMPLENDTTDNHSINFKENE